MLALLLIAALHSDTVRATGLHHPVEIIRDRNGISHIYASDEHDLFFAQGYNAARDRLFQLELWRRQATGTVSELLGPRELQRDIGARLFKYRGDPSRELNSYHPHGAAIVGAFVEGVNAYVAATERNPALLPIEFRLLHTRPRRWTTDVVLSRHQGLLGNVEEELTVGRAVAAAGPRVVKDLSSFHPGDPDIQLDTAVNGSLLAAPILDVYQAWHSVVRFRPNDVVATSRNDQDAYHRLATAAEADALELVTNQRRDIGSNNWVVGGSRTASGAPIMANDPHRAQSVPSLRYWVHLVAPGWDVIGGGEPEIPGVSIGHNQYAAWGLTIFATDGEDLYVYRTNPANRRQYWYKGRWESMRVLRDSIPVKDQPPARVELAYTRHGPVIYEDTTHHVAYALRAAWLEPGAAPYLASLRMDQAHTWDEFRDACAYSDIPGENMVWADRTGNIGWQAVGIAPIRPNFSGLVPVPGDGRYEWTGYLPIKEKPHVLNPASGFIATANNDLIPPGYDHMNAVGFVWSDPFRWMRISEVLNGGHKLTIQDMERLQTDYLSIPARQLVPLLSRVSGSSPAAENARRSLLGWNFILAPASVPAGIYEAWFRHLDSDVARVVVPNAAKPYFRNISTTRLIEWLTSPGSSFGARPEAVRDSIVVAALGEAVAELTQRFGSNSDAWSWGQTAYHHVTINHPLAPAVDAATRALLDAGPTPRGGDAFTVGATGGGDNQTSGASFRIVTDVSEWESAAGINTPGQSGNPDDPHYKDLFPVWAIDRYFTVPYERLHVEAMGESRVVLVPGRGKGE
ncbi:MAG TPA: penicillin acylase family protein [Gemmatimonadaceae bacterium]|jgi:penicillin amidase|nr:penicillin acylase family protein [Gemmatimonadaceae bacterium]